MQQQRFGKVLLSLVAILTMAVSLTILGCDDEGRDATAADLLDQIFTFTDGAAFGITGATTLRTGNGTFRLETTTDNATGTLNFGSCIFTVQTSTFDANEGPQVGDVITATTCEIDGNQLRLTTSLGTSTSSTGGDDPDPLGTGTGGGGGS